MIALFRRYSVLMQLVATKVGGIRLPSMMLTITKNDLAQAAQLLGVMGSSGAVLEFLLNPLIGRCSDKYGRLPFIMLGPIGQFICDLAIAFNPTSMPLVIAGGVTYTR